MIIVSPAEEKKLCSFHVFPHLSYPIDRESRDAGMNAEIRYGYAVSWSRNFHARCSRGCRVLSDLTTNLTLMGARPLDIGFNFVPGSGADRFPEYNSTSLSPNSSLLSHGRYKKHCTH